MIIISHVRNVSIREIMKVRDTVSIPNRTYTKYDIILKIRAKVLIRIGSATGPQVEIVDKYFIRADGNKFKADYLGRLPEF